MRVLLRASHGKLSCGLSQEFSVDSRFSLPTPHADYSDAWSSRYSTPVSESRFPQPSVPFPRRVSIAGGQSFAFASVDRTQNNYRAARRFSAPHIKYVPPHQAPTSPPPPPKPKPPNTPLKLYPWMTKKECSPPRETTIKCPYPTNDCTDVLPSNIVLWRRHFSKKHGLARDKIPQECQWPGCGRWMGGRSLNRHVLTHHMDFKASCPYCKARRRDDHLEKHLSKCKLNPAREIGEE